MVQTVINGDSDRNGFTFDIELHLPVFLSSTTDLEFSKEEIKDSSRNRDSQNVSPGGFEPETPRSLISPTLSTLSQRLQLPNQRKLIFAVYLITILMYTVANPNECNSTLTSATRGETLTPNPNECNSTLTSGTKNI